MVLAVSSYMLSPLAAGATSATAQARQTVAASNECSLVQSFGQTALGNIQTRLSKVNSDAQSDATKRLTAEQSFDAKVQADWTKWDSTRQQNFTALQGEAKTSAEKSAVQTFEATTLAAVTTRRNAVTEARNTFRATVASDATARLTGVDTAIANFQSAVNTAVSSAKASCSTDTASELRSQFVTALHNARVNFQSTLIGLPKLTTEVQAAAQVRTTAVQTADNTFKSTVQDAANTLKRALGQTS